MCAALAVSPLALAACGGGSDLSSDDQDQITKTVQFAAVSGDPKACTQAQTQAFTEQTTGGTGAAAVKQCEKDAADTPADSVDVTNIDGDSDSATADANFKGGVFDGQTIQVELVKDGDQWKLDKAVKFESFDRDAFVAGLKQELANQSGVPAGAITCVSKNLDGLSDQQIEDVFLNSDQKLENQIFGPCFQGG